MPRYLDPKTDLVFKKIFQHAHLLKSFLNALLPLPDDGQIVSLEYLSNEQVPEIPEFKYTIVDVKCKDQQGRIFIVEMQIQWIEEFIQRMVFGTSAAYVRQLSKGIRYQALRPVYGLGLIASTFDKESPDWYHYYKLANVHKPERHLDEVHLVLIELPKFKPRTIAKKKLTVLWLQFMSELNEKTREVPSEWLAVPEIKEAVQLSEEAAYSPGELEQYERYWDAVSSERSLIQGSFDEGHHQGREEGKLETQRAMARKLLANKLTIDQIVTLTDLSIEEIEQLIHK